MYTCPMHPEVLEDKPGKCPKCGMRLVKKDDLQKDSSKSYTPLLVIVGIILLATIVLTFHDLEGSGFSLSKSVSYFMTGFFFVFSGFKLMDLRGFAEGYSTYDLFAKRWFAYGYIYPFIELFFGCAMIVLPFSPQLLIAEILVMGFSGAGVLQKLLRKEKFQCACLGTFLKVPLTKVTLIEDFGMALLALLLLIGMS